MREVSETNNASFLSSHQERQCLSVHSRRASPIGSNILSWHRLSILSARSQAWKKNSIEVGPSSVCAAACNPKQANKARTEYTPNFAITLLIIVRLLMLMLV